MKPSRPSGEKIGILECANQKASLSLSKNWKMTKMGSWNLKIQLFLIGIKRKLKVPAATINLCQMRFCLWKFLFFRSINPIIKLLTIIIRKICRLNRANSMIFWTILAKMTKNRLNCTVFTIADFHNWKITCSQQ